MKTLRYFIAILSVLCFIISLSIAESAAYVDEIRITPVVKAVEKVKGAVVNISTHEQAYERTNPFSQFGNNTFFDRFFRNFFDERNRKRSVRTHLGSGVIIDSRGYVLTNWHVVQRASSITVATDEEREFEAALIGADPKSDLAVLKIESDETFPFLPMGGSEDLLIGETVIAIGNPFGLSHTVTTGVISAVHRSIKANEQIYENFIQTDASINPGNSGGPLLNIKGELIGINTAIYGGAEGIGFATPISTAKRIVDDLLEYGEVRPPWIGISVQGLAEVVSKKLGYTGRYGVVISEVFAGSPAEKSNLKPTDIIISIADQKIKSKTTYKRVMGLYTAHDTIKMKIFRKGSIESVVVTASEFPLEYVDTILWEGFGITIIDNNSKIARKYNLSASSGVVVSEIRRNGQASKKGLEPGDIIRKIQIIEIKDSNDFKRQIVKNIHQESVVLLVQRGRYGYYVNFEL